ncbi:Ribosome maturation factor RimM [Serratia symbiotica]|nr:Ribosome maturation factor RimM [Serratia symbiotica]
MIRRGAPKKQPEPATPEHPVVLGKMGCVYGIMGWLKIFSSTENAESIFDYTPWFIYQFHQWKYIEWEDWKRHSEDFIIKIKGIDDRAEASFLTHREIIVDSNHLPPLEADDYYWKDLIGCQVVTIIGYELGIVIDMIETGANDVMVVQANLQDRFRMTERLLPFVHKQVVKIVDLTARLIEVDWDPGF